MRKINYLGFLSLLSLIAVFGWKSGNTSWYGFFGFLAFVRYFWVVPDELFLMNVQKSATAAFMAGMLGLVPAMFFGISVWGADKAVPAAFATSFSVNVLVFTGSLVIREWKERRSASD